MSRCASQPVQSVGRYRVFEEIEGNDSRMYIRGITDAMLTRGIAVARKDSLTKQVVVTVEHDGTKFLFTQTRAGSNKLLCRELTE